MLVLKVLLWVWIALFSVGMIIMLGLCGYLIIDTLKDDANRRRRK